MNAPCELPPSATIVAHCAEAGDLAAIFEEAVQIAVLPRAVDAGISGYLARAAATGRLCSGFRAELGTGEGSGKSEIDLPDLPGREALVGDITGLAELYGDLLGCRSVGLRLEVIERAMCPRFHVDHVGIRMLCTFRGPGTEWLDAAAADRNLLGARSGGQPDETSGLIRDSRGIHAVPPFAVALLKGDLWQGNAGRGIIHRSPSVLVEQAPRILVAIDAIWD
ncbi:DUF1826 domain-containing protein [Sulfuritalea sp.]|uniref:DUF1826 domain-containing protein n=1 Tax=Sulfuritalea sp. TaxID=2480090 RepID=UPI001AD337CE|nr:DUF1826 domain-containing protein [Sulfuritalea sp.]MBN8474631.1 DUF1826 domain-containing protein [Sulfuritalea sp.]